MAISIVADVRSNVNDSLVWEGKQSRKNLINALPANLDHSLKK